MKRFKSVRPFVLVVPPFYSVARPNLAVSLLKSVLIKAGIPCIIEYSNFRFAQFMGIQDFLTIADTLFPELLIGDWIFAEAAFGSIVDKDVEGYANIIRALIQKEGGTPPKNLENWLKVTRNKANEFVKAESQRLATLRPLAFGFTIAVQQTVSAIALASKIKRIIPVPTIAGGPNCEGVMGKQLWEICDAFDYVCLGEGEAVIQVAAMQIKGNELAPIPGCLTPYEKNNKSSNRVIKAPYTCLNDLPAPDFGDYFQAINQFPYRIEPALVMESSRGCWWGVKSQCTFCGLSKETIAWREKDAEKTLAEIEEVVNTYGNYPILMADLIFPYTYYSTFLPKVKKDNQPRLFYEIKANISQEKMLQLYEAGVRWLLPGIESLSSPALLLMKKGTKAAQNVAILKWAIDYGLSVSWNFIMGFPGEKDEWYHDIISKIASLHHLQPPMSVGDIHLDRYSPLFSNPQLGARKIGPTKAYQKVYPWPKQVLNNIACYFDMEPIENGCQALTKKLLKNEFNNWRNAWSSGQRPFLEGTYNNDKSRLFIKDTRAIALQNHYELSSEATTLIKSAEKPISLNSFMKRINNPERSKAFMELKENKLLFIEDNHLISLITFPNPNCKAEFVFGLPTGFVDTYIPSETELPIIQK
ncbi:bacteriocin maturation radical SAM protein 1 [Legionella lansingensis]|uniref:Radical SAM superfamily protein n=1 Tax=Legionella lansingensis TaxID=45067 RepID=A0A0W0VZL7_9GAMM|nr:RiPP maturation radical SAM C-methyltransferase [Legionella lansingensis]KTD25410.1 Radical SAM superfamily protein [Legionella lansingensis]SNV51391.1 bacteriocin maturation radical SAM protein 1 [Legionella lansingensis]